MRKRKKDYKTFKAEDLEKEKEFLIKKSKTYEHLGKFGMRISFGPLIVGIIISIINLIPGLCLTAIMTSIFISGWINMSKSIKCENEIKLIKEELLKRPVQLGMEEVFKHAYQPTITKSKTTNVELKDTNDLSI